MSWTQPVCEQCWFLVNITKEPVRMKEADPERCCKCGVETNSGIYIRVDPKTVPFPRDDGNETPGGSHRFVL